MKKLMLLILFTFSVIMMYGATKEEIAFEERLERTRYPVELDFKGTPLSDVLGIISKMSGITIVASSNTVNMPVDLYLPRGQNLKKIVDTLKTTNGLTSKLINDTMVLQKETGIKDDKISYGKVVGKVVEIDKMTGIKGVTLSLGDDVNTLVLSDVGGAFIINDVNAGTYILKATMRDYKPSGEIVEVKPNGVTQITIILSRLKSDAAPVIGIDDKKEPGKVVAANGTTSDTKVIPIKYADPEEIKKNLEKVVPLSSIVVNPKTNSLTLIGMMDNIKTAENMIELQDVPIRQVRIRAKIWDVSKTAGDTIEGNLYGGRASKKGSEAVATLAKTGDGSNYYNGALGSSGLALGFTGFLGNESDVISAVFTYLRSTQDAELMSEPSIVAMDGGTAELKVITEVAVGEKESTDDDGNTTKEPLFKEAGTILSVIPSIKSDNKTIQIEIKTEISEYVASTEYEKSSGRKSQNASTKVVVRDGETIRIGGLTTSQRSVAEAKVPILGDIPLIGYLFKKSQTSNTERNLYIELTPEIIDTTRGSAAQTITQ